MSAAKIEKKKVIKFGVEDLNLKSDDPKYSNGINCVLMYWARATTLETHEQEEMIEYLRNHDYYIEPSAKVGVASHKLYRATMQAYDAFGLEGLSRPVYLILSSLYFDLPEKYLQLIRDRFGSVDIINHSQEYWKAISKSAVATNAATIRNKDEEDVASRTEEQVAVLDPVRQAKQSVALEEAKCPRALSDNPAVEPKRTRRATDKGGFDIDHVVAGIKSSLAIQRFVDTTKPASTTAEKPRMTSSDLLEMKEDVKIAKDTAMRNEAKIDAASTKLDGFISEMRPFMTAFANTADIPLPIEIVDESDNDNHE
ncbi:hypothetical protein M431DRAFT_83003 [Trichoderma harzianum CBS 226.95]|uniref:Uncharacterized protein n=1 Tax=Trichoderma harzianum CBS 226.95 TaxID=983964 RepID=A0A2T4AG36_TRIHA|nr:hypothetical protein M431DRAFT_83003 [Trichoderma harzianum CBS 226.95]PTB56026.1 hypothetical protein M431DRAFT_83003 [Trichoderma harzianum CBS 226.95]